MTNSLEEWRVKHKKAYDDFYEEFSHHENIFRYNESAMALYEHGKEYALSCIKSLFWINGGALLAIAPLSQAFGVIKNDNLFDASYCFSGGLISVILTALLAYLSCARGAIGVYSGRNADYHTYILKHVSDLYSEESKKSIATEQKSNRDIANKNQKYASIFEVMAIIFGLASLFFFVFGTFNLLNVIPLKDVVVAEQKIEQIQEIINN